MLFAPLPLRARQSAAAAFLAAALLASPSVASAAALWNASGSTVSAASANQLLGFGPGMSVSDGAGGAYFVWVDSRNVGTSGVNAYALRVDSTGNPASGWPANGLQISAFPTGDAQNEAFAGQLMPAAAGDGAGGLFVTWQDFRSGNGDVYAQRVSPSGVKLWSANGVLVSSGPTLNGEQGGGPFSADDGGLFVFFFDSAPVVQGGLNWRVQKLNPADGSRLFSDPFGKWITSSTVQRYEGASFPVTDGANGMIGVFADRRAGPNDADAFAIRVDSNGDKVWDIVVASGTADQGLGVQAVSDGSGGAYAVWMDSRAGNGEVDLYATRILNTGVAAANWSIGNLGGKPVCTTVGAQLAPMIALYGTDPVMVWTDLRNGVSPPFTYAQRLNGTTGNPVWTANGVPMFQVSGGLSNSVAAPIVTVSGGNIFVAAGWLQTSFGCGSVCYSDVMIGQALDPADGAQLFGSTGTLLGTIAYNAGNIIPYGVQAVPASDNTAIFAWDSGAQNLNGVDILAQKLSTGSAGGGGGGSSGSTTTLSAYFAVASSDTIIAQWKSVPGNNYIAVLSTESSFASVLSSATVADTFRSTYTALTPSKIHYFKVKIATEADTAYGTAIQAVTGPVGISSVAFSIAFGSSGSGDGQLNNPLGLDVDASGNIYVADTNNNRIQKFDSSGNLVRKWPAATTAGSADGEFNLPYDVAVDASGNVYVAELSGSRVQKFDSNGNFLLKWGALGSGNGQFISLSGIAVDASGNVYTTERGNYRVQKFDSTGAFLTKWGSLGSGDGQFNGPWGIDVDPAGNVVVMDALNASTPPADRVQKFDSNGNFIRKWGSRGSYGGLFTNPRQLAVDSSSNVYVAELSNNRVSKFSPEGVFLGSWGSAGSGNGQFSGLSGIAADAAGNIYTVEATSRRVQRFGAAGIVPLAAPTGTQFTAVSTSSLSVSWTVSPGNTYVMVLSTQVSFAAVVSSATGALDQNTTGYFGLSPAATYYFKVKVSTHPDSSYSSVISTVTGVPPAPANVRYTAVSTTSLSVAWDLSSGVSYVMVLSSVSSFAAAYSSGTGSLNQNTTTYAVTSGTWYFKVKVSTHPDASYSGAISTTSALTPGASLSEPVPAAAATTFNIPAPLPIKLDIPAGAFGGANNVTATLPATIPEATANNGASVTPLGQAIQLDLQTPVAQFAKAVEIAITIPPPASPANVYLAWYDTILRTWWPIWSSYYSAALGQVIGQAYHFTTFAAVTVSAATTLDDLTVYPNPVDFGSAVRGTVKFMGLTGGADISIYTVTGELVRHLPPGYRSGASVNTGTTGFAEWDGRNESGSLVARGTYLYVIKDPKSSRKTGRIGVKR